MENQQKQVIICWTLWLYLNPCCHRICFKCPKCLVNSNRVRISRIKLSALHSFTTCSSLDTHKVSGSSHADWIHATCMKDYLFCITALYRTWMYIYYILYVLLRNISQHKTEYFIWWLHQQSQLCTNICFWANISPSLRNIWSKIKKSQIAILNHLKEAPGLRLAITSYSQCP